MVAAKGLIAVQVLIIMFWKLVIRTRALRFTYTKLLNSRFVASESQIHKKGKTSNAAAIS